MLQNMFPAVFRMMGPRPLARTVLPPSGSVDNTIKSQPREALGSLAAAQKAEREGRLDDAWAHCLVAIGERPFHPDAFVQLASIAAAGGDLEAAQTSLRRAGAMAPQWPLPPRLLDGLGHGSTTPSPMGAASQRRFILPVQTHRLSVCLIVRNEERFLDGCLRSIRALADEILVVDTGSTDRTVDIARSHGAHVDSFAWCNDFSAARNAGLERARGDWVLILDADEELMPEDHDVLLRELRSGSNHLLLRLRCIQELQGRRYQGYVPRLFRNAPGIWFHDTIHESVTQTVSVLCDVWGMELGLSRTRLLHHGYTPEVVQERGKVGRNHALLVRAVADNPGNAYMQMQLGSEYLRMNEEDKAFEHFADAVRLCEDSDRLVPDSVEGLLTLYGTNLLRARRFEETERLLTGRLAGRFPPIAWHRYLRGRARMELGRFSEALEDLLDCHARRAEETLSMVPADLDTPELEFMIGELLGRLDRQPEAERFLREALARDRSCVRYAGATARMISRRGDPVAALGLLLEHLPECSNSIDLWILGGQIAMDGPGLESFAVEWIRDAMAHHPGNPALQILNGAALIQAGMMQEAHLLFESLAGSRQPKVLGGLLFSGISCGNVPLPDLGPQEQRSAILTIVGILQQLHARQRGDLIEGFRRSVGAHAERYPWIAEAFGSTDAADPIPPSQAS